MTPEQIRNQCEDDADRVQSDLTVWRDRGVIIAAQQTRIAKLEAQIARVETLANEYAGMFSYTEVQTVYVAAALRKALS